MASSRYDGVQITLHWLMALLILSAFGLALYINTLPLSPVKFKLYAYHKWLGISVLLLVLVRLAWRLRRGVPPPLAGQPAWQRKAAAGTHHLLYLLMVALPLVGWAMSSAKGFPVVLFGLIPLPDFVPRDPDLGDRLKLVHMLLAYGLIGLVGLHALAALKHQFVDRDGTLRRMLPQRD
ncbi:cytochrome b [Chitiniphilus purpureus]|uniref:Cytochrome b n=1 Tax=Chitiniphilus purpureus TaxID=2981137 RepID=A0ABY6DRA9_9NEIS|nr:cytochrome b [Chitiniphilus sp. CD1]UXY16895.1 cytochrome b [Chitiniphilus sp. CD1]